MESGVVAVFDVGNPDRFRETDLDHGSAGKVDAVVGSLVKDQGDQADQDHHKRDPVSDLPLSDEVDVHVRFDDLHECSLLVGAPYFVCIEIDHGKLFHTDKGVGIQESE